MKDIQLTQGQVAFVDDADFEKVMAGSWRALFNGRHWYAARGVRLPNGKWATEYMHRFILGLGFGDPLQVDHRDRTNTLLNTRENLRVTLNQNPQNVGKRIDNTSGVKGVSWSKRDQRWRAQIRDKGKMKSLGNFTSLEAARDARDAAAAQLHGEFAVLNTELAVTPTSERLP